MNLGDIKTDIRTQANLNAEDLTDALLLPIVNKYKNLVASTVADLNEDRFYEISTSDTTTTEPNEYTLPSDMMRLKRIEVTYDGTTWNVVKHLDVNELDDATDATSVRENFSTSDPHYDLIEQSIFLFPAPTSAITGGLKIHYIQRPADLAADGDDIHAGIPESFHYLIVEGALMDVGRRFRKTDVEDRARMGFFKGLESLRKQSAPRTLDGDLAFKVYEDNYTD